MSMPGRSCERSSGSRTSQTRSRCSSPSRPPVSWGTLRSASSRGTPTIPSNSPGAAWPLRSPMAPDEPADAVARVVHDRGTAGTAFLLSREHRLLATCAHVVEYAGSGPGDRVELAFRASREPVWALVEPERWLPPEGEDVAILRALAEPPEA